MTLDLTGTSKRNIKKIIDRSKIFSFKNTALKFELAKRGDYTNLDYNPTFKASAIFFILLNKKLNSKICFLNYWKLKNKNDNLSLLYTIRDNKGHTILRNFSEINKFTYEFDVRDILKNYNLKDFKGTFELEFFSNQDLKYAFPAIQIFYETLNGFSSVHTNQRIFNDLTDDQNNKSLNDLQTGFDVYSDNKYFSFFTFINGPIALKNKKIKIEFYNIDNKKIIKTISFKNILPYEVLYIEINKIIGKTFFKNNKGFCKVLSPTKNVFNRIMVGTFSKDKKYSSVTHSYYDCSKTKDYLRNSYLEKNSYKCFLPFNMAKNINLDLVFYPIFSKTDLAVDLEIFSKNKKRSVLKNVFKLNKSDIFLRNININQLIKENNLDDKAYCLNFRSKDDQLPSRFTFGM
ncbi:hypothetical protein OAQ43_02600, partial [Alphaproteobacteria bacterium]|nr:hypothetical protein [Alphaproteobacteria bacterium]